MMEILRISDKALNHYLEVIRNGSNPNKTFYQKIYTARHKIVSLLEL